MKKVIERNFVKRGGGGKSGNVSANAFLNFVGANDHSHGVPAHQALDAALHFLAAGEWGLRLGVDSILVWSSRREGKIYPSGAARVQRQLLQQSACALRSTMRKNVIERIQPLPRFQDFNTVRLLRLSHYAPTYKIAMLSS